MSQIVFLDTNVVLDHLAERQPFAPQAAAIWDMAERREIVGYVSALSFSNIYYIVRRLRDTATANRVIRSMRDVFEVAAVDAQVVNQALESKLADFEDAVQYCCAVRVAAACLVTRDVRHFRQSEVPVLAPDAFIAQRRLK